ncbi:hypothetical protein Hanom_Chr16g01445111 [Helianthus anomalus]
MWVVFSFHMTLTYESSNSVQARLGYYILIDILNKNKINSRLFRLASSISEAWARLLNKLILSFEVGL